MAGAIEVELDEVYAGLDAMVRAGKDLRPVFRAARGDLMSDLKEHFAERRGPDGGWPPPAQSTIEHMLSRGGRRRNVSRKGHLKRRAAKRLANQLGRLKSAWSITYTRGELAATSKVAWAGIHQFGGTAGHGSRIPVRTFAWASEKLLGFVAERVATYIASEFTK